MSNVVTRFAPSPTGFMHVGGVRTALYAWLFAKQKGGTFILRIEDTDKAREIEGSIPHIIESLRWLGIEWSEGPDIGGQHAPYLQSERLASYKKYAELLIEKGHAYADPYTEEEVEAFRQKAEAEKRPFLYRDHRPETTEVWDGTKPLRFRVPEIKRYVWNDMVRGELSAGEEALDDFILIKSDGYPTYNFAHIIDDLEMNVTHIMRGEEFISSTPKFLSLYDALEITRPEIATLPVILGPDGNKKLSKRDNAKDLLEYRDEGYLPETMVNFLALLGWHPEGEQEVLTREELIAMFDISRVQKGGAKLDDDKLRFLNREHMRKLTDDAFIEAGNFTGVDTEILKKIVPLLRERAHTFGEARTMLTGELLGLFQLPALDKTLLISKAADDAVEFTKMALEGVFELINSLPEDVSAEAVKEALMPYADEKGRGGVLFALRYALSGQERSPDPFTLISIIGKEGSLSRIKAALAIL